MEDVEWLRTTGKQEQQQRRLDAEEDNTDEDDTDEDPRVLFGCALYGVPAMLTSFTG